MLDPRQYGLFEPAYPISDPVVRRAVGGRNKVYLEASAGRLHLTKRGNRTLILAPDLAAYLQALRERSTLLPSPNPRARREKSFAPPRPQAGQAHT
jgi:hypothetical protein